MSIKAKVPKIGIKLTSTEKDNLGNTSAFDGVLGRTINPGIKKIREL